MITENRFERIFENFPAGIFILDASGKILRANERFLRLVKKTAAQISGTAFSCLVYPADRPAFVSRFREFSGGKNTRNETICRYTRGGKEKLAAVTMTYLSADALVFGMFEDVTRRKNEEARLRREKEAAEKAARTKSSFLANMSHEIRTPMHTIIGMTDLLAETKLDLEQKEYAGQIRYSADVLLGLINDILDFSKIEAGKLSLEMIDCDFVTLIREVVDMISLLAHKKGLEVILDMSRDIPRWVRTDPTRIRQVVINLFNNAVKFTKKGQIIVRVSPVYEIEKIRSVKFEVIDTGIGIPQDKLDMLFQTFTQVDSSMTRKYGGTGLGLSISKSIIQMMNGIIDVKSEPGKGSNFWFVIPLEIVSDREVDVETVVEGDLAAKRILIADDNADARKTASLLLANYFTRVEEASSGKEALEMLAQASSAADPFALVLVDLHLSDMDGWQLASEIKNNPLIKDALLVLCSPLGSSTEAKMKRLGWFARYLAKPLKADSLIDGVASALSGEPSAEDAAADETEEKPPGPERRAARLLVAEDHPVNQQLFRTILEKLGCAAELADNGRQAVEKASAGNFDLVFMDIQMPEMNGVEAAKTMRAMGLRLPIVAVTANALKEERDECLAAGMNDFLTKPFRAQHLVPILEKWLPKRLEEDGAAAENTTGSAPPGNDVFDFTEAVKAFMGRKDTVIRVMRQYQAKVELQLASMREALTGGNWDGLRLEAHGIKGGGWNLQAKALGDAAALLEQAAAGRDTQAAEKALDGLAAEYKRLNARVAALPDFAS